MERFPEVANLYGVHTLYTIGETEELARNLASTLHRGMVVGLIGDLGAGKSVCVRAAGAALGITERMPSPSYTLVEEYETTGTPILHIDLYRLADPGEFFMLGVEERFDEAITFIEWIDRAPEIATRADVIVELSIEHEHSDLRVAKIRGGSGREDAS